KRKRVSPSAFEARPVARSECCRLVEEEQLGVSPWSHHLAMAPAELQFAADPLLCNPAAAAELLVRPVQAAAAVAHHGPARRDRDDLPFRRDTVLEGHLVLGPIRRRLPPLQVWTTRGSGRCLRKECEMTRGRKSIMTGPRMRDISAIGSIRHARGKSELQRSGFAFCSHREPAVWRQPTQAQRT